MAKTTPQQSVTTTTLIKGKHSQHNLNEATANDPRRNHSKSQFRERTTAPVPEELTRPYIVQTQPSTLQNNSPSSTMKPRHIFTVGNGGVNTDSLREQEGNISQKKPQKASHCLTMEKGKSILCKEQRENKSTDQQSVREGRTNPHTMDCKSFYLCSA